MNARAAGRLALAIVAVGGAPGCGAPPPEAEEIPIGLMLSYSGYLAASSINSDRALRLAVEAANAAGGVGGRRLKILARDTRSDGTKIMVPARELVDAGAALLIGPDTTDLASQLRGMLQGRTIMLPSFNTASDVEFKPPSWFVMGAGIARVACELVTHLRADGHQHPLVIVNPSGYNTGLSWELTNRYGFPKYVLPAVNALTASDVRPIASLSADSYVLAAFPASGSSLVFALAALESLQDPSRWYLSPTLHTPAFLRSIPRGVFQGARGVSPGTVAGAAEFRALFDQRWHDAPMDDAYPFYDAGVIAALALQRALTREGTIPTGTGLSQHIVAVTHSGGTPIEWNQLQQGLALLAAGQEVQYLGLSGSGEFDLQGQTSAASINWWAIGPDGFVDIPHESACGAQGG
jgi:ABC-type branched-subunit amino acid transport system substrate-binding protein